MALQCWQDLEPSDRLWITYWLLSRHALAAFRYVLLSLNLCTGFVRVAEPNMM